MRFTPSQSSRGSNLFTKHFCHTESNTMPACLKPFSHIGLKRTGRTQSCVSNLNGHSRLASVSHVGQAMTIISIIARHENNSDTPTNGRSFTKRSRCRTSNPQHFSNLSKRDFKRSRITIGNRFHGFEKSQFVSLHHGCA